LRFGFHCSIAGGLSKALDRAKNLGCDTLQFFTRNPRGWSYASLDPKEVKAFRLKARHMDLYPLVVHMPYLPNLASDDGLLYQKSLESLKVEMKRCKLLGVDYLVTHVGKTKGRGRKKGMERVAWALREVLELPGPLILLENTAGQGSELGFRMEELGEIFSMVGEDSRLGICIDTAHAFQAGYPIHTPDGLEGFLSEVSQWVGLERLRLLHLNDSKTPLGSRVDRHWHIGEGYIGLEGFKGIIRHPILRDLPAIMETPWSPQWDRRNMARVRALAAKDN